MGRLTNQAEDGNEDQENAEHDLFPREDAGEVRNALLLPEGVKRRYGRLVLWRIRRCGKPGADRLIARRLVERRNRIPHVTVHLRRVILVESIH